jgi:SPP1 family predicted phage head-tail adaptor
MSASSRTCRVTIEQVAVDQANGLNEPLRTWSTWRTRWAAILPSRGREYASAVERFGETVARFEFDYRDADGILQTMRLRYGGQVYDIKAVLPDHARRRSIVVEAVTTTEGAA